jgi:hypothetical protein
MWISKSKRDLIIEVWEKLDCENIGAAEIEAIEEVLRERLGPQTVESPMKIARLLADEGAELRHAEIMNLFVERYEEKPYKAEFRNILNTDDLKKTRASIRKLENLRKKFTADGDKEGLRLIRDRVIAAKKDLPKDATGAEIAQWLTVWLQTPEIFESWLKLRERSADFESKFGKL